MIDLDKDVVEAATLQALIVWEKGQLGKSLRW